MSMQSTCLERLGGEKMVNPKLQETTLIQQLFGGRLKSKVPFVAFNTAIWRWHGEEIWCISFFVLGRHTCVLC
jgi:ubiquitin carboxyl-terminal hydrolase 36/42